MNVNKILGLDLGISSIGWAYVQEDSKNPENNKIIKLGVRVNPLTVDEQLNFEKGKPITTNAGRTLARSARRNLQRFKLRRSNLIDVLKKNNILKETDLLAEVGKNSTFQTQELRAKAAKEQIELSEFARVLLLINKKRGYRSSRKAKNDEEGQIVDGMAVAKKLYEENLTPGEYSYQLLQQGKKQLPDFYRSDLQAEFDKIWDFQKQFNPEIFSHELYGRLQGKNRNATWKELEIPFSLVGIKQTGTMQEKKAEKYFWRSEAVKKQLDFESLAIVFQEINSNLNNSSGYLGAISDRSKELYFKNQTVGEYLFHQLKVNPHTKLKNQVFYRQDYLDEFEKIWETQSKYHKELTQELKGEVRDIIIFYQRKLKSQKGLISICEFENREIEITENGKTKKKTLGLKVAPKSSPLFQEFKIWQVLNNLQFQNVDNQEVFPIVLDCKQSIFNEVNVKGKLSAKDVLDLIGYSGKEWKTNFKEIEGNYTNENLYNAFLKIIASEGIAFPKEFKLTIDDEIRVSKINASSEIIQLFVKEKLSGLGIDTSVLDFNPELDGNDFEKQSSYQLWHLLYSYEGDDSPSGNEKLYELLQKKFGFRKEHSKILAEIVFPQDYGSLSSKAMRKIYPYIKEHKYSTACNYAGYNHSKNSLTKEQLENRPLKEQLEILPKNSLRNPVVEKILNQMINLVNEVSKEYGRPDEIIIELARELKFSAEERAIMTSEINKATIQHQKYAEILKKEFNIPAPSRNDIIRYKLYLELANNGFKDLYTDVKIERGNLFTEKYDIDHIIPQSRFFDDSFSNKVLVPRSANLKKGNFTAFDYLEIEGKDKLEKFLNIIKDLYDKGAITKAKFEKLQKKGVEIGDGFIERDLRNTQYIAKKAKEILLGITNYVTPTSGRITEKLREDWNLVNTMKELNLEKYRKLGLTETVINSKGEEKQRIINWTKRNDHRHHAMDALTVAFTTHNHIQYLNYLNARKNEAHKAHKIITNIENNITEVIEKKNGSKQRRFKEPVKNLRAEAKKHLDEILISHKAKNKVVTRNINKIKKKGSVIEKAELTPRGQLHKETIYGSSKFLKTKEEKVSGKFDVETIQKVQNERYRNALLNRLQEFGGDPKKAFTGKNIISKNPIFLDAERTDHLPETVTLAWYETGYTIRKAVNPDNFKDFKNIEKVIDKGIRDILTERLKEFNGNSKEAFSDLEKNPIWLNKSKGISIKAVTITGINNAEALHYKKDHLGKDILDEDGQRIAVDFVSTGNNHHVAIYEDENGNLQEKVVSFYEAVERVNQKLPAIDKEYNSASGWKFLFTMKQNEMFLFPSEDFDPKEVDLFDEKNLSFISKNLFRVQKIATKDYFFRHHLETTVEDNSALKGITWRREGLSGLKNVWKVRLNHLGKIVQVGEY
ncbi:MULTISPECIES: type II CRISPR RNA-guided endonuclease Cas9 [Chryseobacterium]|uniref:CRISPR-associated endonuclease Cas9 n=1 Tax=Chryseobacterium camelliae TaxID=1265445 RepID=A0ABU0THG7_9FLAO|nr:MULTISPECIES: type II CRISPR RNA-guided endonuclease Cas9 [Chryseobacterium]MDQ1096495.1 CRISPR-associated endonuclease Csn1 [Chryseobacterium camelliae]MDR6087776.1 CRISPR-associated endonuclease Csn1 [Chryseobacterium sp. SORGH_AS_0909]MDR6132152.1 CRISPR-associated endonuclease Csn1 [Chryseobacterium sp. SORGH_AS_1175]